MIAASGGHDLLGIPDELLFGAGTLERQHLTAGTHKRQAPRGQPSQGSDRSSGHDVLSAQLIAHRPFLSTSPHHLGGQFEFGDDFPQPRHSPGHRLQESEVEIRASDCQWDPRQSRPRAYVDNTGIRRQQLREDGRVQQMSLPKPVHLPRADDAARDALLRE